MKLKVRREMRFALSGHAESELPLRRIPRELLESTLNSPQQIVPERGNKKVYRSQLDFGTGKVFLLRAIVDDTVNPAVVITVYRTSKISKYWRQP